MKRFCACKPTSEKDLPPAPPARQQFRNNLYGPSSLGGYSIFSQGIFAHNPPIKKVRVSPLHAL
jgi:hypothetical protein